MKQGAHKSQASDGTEALAGSRRAALVALEQPTESLDADDLARPFARRRRGRPAGRLVAQRLMGPRRMIMVKEHFENVPQVSVTVDQEMIQAVDAKGLNHAFGAGTHRLEWIRLG